MKIDIKAIPESGLNINSNEKYSICAGYNDKCNVSVEFNGRLILVKPGEYKLSGHLSINDEFNCDKCLEIVYGAYSKDIQEIFTNNGDEDSWPIDKSCIELSPIFLANIYSMLPTKILCKADCKGLCSFCGKNLNQGNCGCEKPLDPRFSLLSSFLGDEEV